MLLTKLQMVMPMPRRTLVLPLMLLLQRSTFMRRLYKISSRYSKFQFSIGIHTLSEFPAVNARKILLVRLKKPGLRSTPTLVLRPQIYLNSLNNLAKAPLVTLHGSEIVSVVAVPFPLRLPVSAARLLVQISIQSLVCSPGPVSIF